MPLVLLGLLLIGLTDSLALAYQYWFPGRIFDGSTSGVWTALAFDFSEGFLYRPIFSGAGYGGTRYMPLFFMIHGGLIRFGLDPVSAGFVAMQTSVGAMLVVMFLILRRLGLSVLMAAGLALVSLCTSIFQQYVTDVNCDYFAATLGLIALATYLPAAERPEGRSRSHLALAAGFSALAFCTKFTSVYVPAAILLHLALNRRWSDAMFFVGAGVMTVAALVGLLEVTSGGLMWENLARTATGGTEISYAIWFPLRFVEEIFYQNPAVGVLFVTAAIAWLSNSAGQRSSPVGIAFAMNSLATLITFASAGIAGNHVIALQAFSLLMIGACLTDVRIRAVASTSFALLSIFLVAAWLPGVPSPRKSLDIASRETAAELTSAIQEARQYAGPVLSDNPMVPVILGERAYLLDKFSFDKLYRTDPDVRADFESRISNRQFPVIVLSDEFDSPAREIMHYNYNDAGAVGGFRILVPRTKAAGQSFSPTPTGYGRLEAEHIL